MMGSADAIIEAALLSEAEVKRTKLILGLSYYTSAMKLLSVHCILSDEE
jgi:hypothetical protein